MEEGEETSKVRKQRVFMAVWSVSCDVLITLSTHHSVNDRGPAGEANASAEEENPPPTKLYRIIGDCCSF